MSKQKIEVEVDVPEGYKVTAYRVPREGDTWLSPSHLSLRMYRWAEVGAISGKRFIVERHIEEPGRRSVADLE